MALPPVTVGFLASGQLSQVSHQSQSASDKGNNEMKLGALVRSHGIYLKAGGNPEKPQLGVSLMKPLRPVIVSNDDPYLKMMSLRSYRKSGKKRNGEKEGKRRFNLSGNILDFFKIQVGMKPYNYREQRV